MSFWSELGKILGLGKKKPAPTPPTPPVPSTATLGVHLFEGDSIQRDIKVPNALVTVSNSNRSLSKRTDGAGNVWFEGLPIEAYDIRVSLDGYEDAETSVAFPRDVDLLLSRKKLSVVKRTGVVRGVGTQWVDNDGAYCPLGATLFWALRGWKFERERVKQNIIYLRSQGIDYIRILGEVQWPGNDISPDAWGDWDALMAEFLDWCYNEVGMRVQVTLYAGGNVTNFDRLVDRFIAIARPRLHTLQFVEVCNEAFQNYPNPDALKRHARKLRNELSPLPVAVSSPAPADETCEESRTWVREGTASATVMHFERSLSDMGWKGVRKPWEGRGQSAPSAHNEPQGPRSSGEEYTEPIHLVMQRAVGILCGYDAHVIHNGAGVSGQVNEKYRRPANVWEVPGVDEGYAACRQLDKILPPEAGVGQPTRKGMSPHPSEAHEIWPASKEGATTGAVRDYAITKADGSFWQTLFGIREYVRLKFNASYHVTVYNPVTGDVISEHDVNPATTLHIAVEKTARASNGTGAVIIRGVRR